MRIIIPKEGLVSAQILDEKGDDILEMLHSKGLGVTSFSIQGDSADNSVSAKLEIMVYGEIDIEIPDNFVDCTSHVEKERLPTGKKILRTEVVQKAVINVIDWAYTTGKEIDLSKPLEDYGIDSLDIVELAIHIEDKFEINIDEQIPEEWKTAQDVVDSAVKSLNQQYAYNSDLPRFLQKQAS